MRLLILEQECIIKTEEFIFKEEIVAFVENDEKKRGQIIEGIQIISLGQIREMDYDFICLMVKGEYNSTVTQWKNIDFSLKVYYSLTCLDNSFIYMIQGIGMSQSGFALYHMLLERR